MAFGNPVSANESEPMPKRVIVQVKGTETGDLNGEVISSKQVKKQTTLTLEVPKGTSTAAFIKELKQEENVLRVEEDHLMKLTYTPSDIYYGYQTHHSNIQSEESWERSRGGNVIVAILDNGIDVNHEDLKTNIVNPYDVVQDSPYTLSPGDHGTHVAGIVGSQMDNYYGGVGVAAGAFIMPIDVFEGTSAYTSDVIEGVYRAVDQGADIINMSLGNYYYSTLFQQAIYYAYANDVLVIAAAGNDSSTSTHYPSSYEHVISVGSTTSYDTLSSFSNYGWNVDVTAPGSSILSTTPYNTYSYKSGTSMASPVVAGVAALVKAAEPNISVDELAERLTSTADDLGSPGRDYYYGYGRINAKAALMIYHVDPVQVDAFSDLSDVVTGTIPQNNGYGNVVVYGPSGESIGLEEGLYGGDRFSIKTSRYPAGTTLSAIFYDRYGNYSELTRFTVVDKTAPVKPSVNPVSDAVTTVSGKAEPASTVTVKAGTTLLGQVTTSEDGTYTVTIGKQKAGTVLVIASTDAAGNVSPIVETTVMDKTAPVAPIVSEVTDQSLEVKGTAEADTTIVVKVGATELGKATVSKEGAFRLAIPKQATNTRLRVTSIDRAGNVSPAVEVVVLDRTAPSIPTVQEVSDQMVTVSGTAEANARIQIKRGSNEIGTGTVQSNGTFQVSIVKQAAGTVLTVTAIDGAGNTSQPLSVLVTDKTAPALQIDQITNQSVTVRGVAEARAIIEMTDVRQTVKVTADENGRFRFTIPAPKTGETFSFVASDVAGNQTDVLNMTVVDATAPILFGVSDVVVEAGLAFDMKRGVSATDETDGHLTAKVVISGAVDVKKPGVYVLTYTVKDRAGNEGKMIRRVTVKDTVKPVLTGVKTKTIFWNSRFDAKKGITATDNISGNLTKSIKVSGKINVKKVGSYYLTYSVTDKSGNTTTAVRKIVVKDHVKPVISGAKSKTIKFKSNFKPLTGVTAKDNVDGTLTKSIKVTGKVNTQRKGVYPLTYTVKDKAGNSTVVKVKITVK
ncbi:Ig-like domain-containing protein [Exiguobacterium sp. SL-9]|uniref:Ig-like domain-containing protein n=1 Tax=Exiguobacterium sp. SL-9 TaxID=2510963 RepID=UPI00137560FD|nr:Ig-like domain-containing protein [Exiguobacterium sp. SL-9]